MMKRIKLTQGKFALVSNIDYKYLNQWKWRAHNYAVRGTRQGGRTGQYKNIWMHRIIARRMGLKIYGKEIDHINQDRFDNRRENLRIVSKSLNHFNTHVRRDSQTGIKGVYPHYGKYQATITIDQHVYYLGTFETIKKAKDARINAEKELLPHAFLSSTCE